MYVATAGLVLLPAPHVLLEDALAAATGVPDTAAPHAEDATGATVFVVAIVTVGLMYELELESVE